MSGSIPRLPAFLASLATCCLTAAAGAQTWNEVGDAGQTLATANITTGSGPLTRINGTIGNAGQDADIYCIRITNRATFTASTVGQTTLDTELFLFDSTGRGVAFNDDLPGGTVTQSRITGQFVPAAGLYYLAIAGYNYKPASASGNIWLDMPFAAERAPDGPGAAGVLTGWSGADTVTGAYSIVLTGASFCLDTASPGCPPNFAPAVNYPAGSRPASVAVGDLNGDGKPDLVVANFGGTTVSVLLGNGDGTFQAAANYPAGSSPVSVAIGDFNRDGKPDLAVANGISSGTVSVLLGNGDGTFQAPVNYAAGTVPNSVAIGDVNGDGKPDLVVANFSSNNVSVLLGTGTGSFGAATNFPSGGTSESVAIGDVNGDGKPDLVIALQGGTVSVLIGTGTGTFGAPTPFGAGNIPVSVAIGDVNGDGKLDVVAANQSGDNVSVLLGNGNGTLQTAVNYPGPAGDVAESVAIGDVNGDGKPDLVVTFLFDFSSPGVVSVLLGNGDGTFQTPVSYPAGITPDSAAVADFNGDGKPDLAVANSDSGNVSVLLQLPGVPVPTITMQPSVQFAAAGSPASFSVGATSPSGGLTYQWRRNGIILSGTNYTGTTTPTLAEAHVGLVENGAVFDCIVSNPCGSTISNGASVVVSPQPTGACCHGATCFIAIGAVQCTAGGIYLGDGTICNPLSRTGALNACCRADFNNSGAVSVQDLFDFLGAWFAGCP